MIELIEKTVFTALGAMTLGQRKAEELLSDLKERFNLTEEEGRALLTKLENAAKDNQRKLEEIAQQEVKKACERLGVVTAEEFEKLHKKVRHLEKQLKAGNE
ncbi:MAG TPA: phasin family protein [Desulfuromonadales bacterium]|nr:phasin family protein [Desulfuromonadales bacterium]